MYKITIKIDGMMCGMCEAHVCDAIRRAGSVKKVTASHSRGEAVVIAESFNEVALRKAIDATGYQVLDVKYELYEKKGLFRR